MCRWVVAAIVLTSCGRLDFAPRQDASARDAACTLGPWSTPTPLSMINTTSNDYSPSMSADGLTLWFLSNASGLGGYDIFQATRTDVTQPFGTVTNLAALNSTFDEESPTLSANELTIYFSSTQGGSMRLYRSTRSTPTSGWAPPLQIPELAAEDIWGANLSRDGSELVYNHRATQIELAHATYAAGAFSLAGTLDSLNTIANAGWPSLSSDRLTIYFEGVAAGDTQSNVFTATRPSVGATWGAITPVDVASTPNVYEGNPEISSDGLTLLFSATGTAGSADIFSSTRACN